MLVSEHDSCDLVEWRPGVRTLLRAAASTGASKLCILEQWCDPGTGAPTHTHFEVEEAITVVSGRSEFWVDGEHAFIAPGATVLLPAHSYHGFRNVGADVLHTRAVFSAAAPPVEYQDEPGVILEIGGGGTVRRDAHRAVREFG